MKITREQGGQEFPPGSVVVRVPRSEFPIPFSKNSPYDEADDPYQRVKSYNLVIVASGVVNSQIRGPLASIDRLAYCFVYSGQSGRLYKWGDYYEGSYHERGLPVGGPLVLVDCLPAKDHHNPPRAVNVYASTAGVVWLAGRSCGVKLLMEVWAKDFESILEMEDAPFSTYFDRFEESEVLKKYTEEFREKFRTKLNLYFGLGG